MNVVADTDPRVSEPQQFPSDDRATERRQTRTGVSLVVNWLREVSGNVLDGEFNRTIATDLDVAVDIESSGAMLRVTGHRVSPLPEGADALLTVLLGFGGAPEELDWALENFPAYLMLPAEHRDGLEVLFGPTRTEVDLAAMQRSIEPIRKFRDRLLESVVEALGKHYSVELSAVSNADPNDSGDGDSGLGDGFAGVPSTTTLELHLPLLDKMQWRRRHEILAASTIEVTASGQIVVRPSTDAPRSDYELHRHAALVMASGLGLPGWNEEPGHRLQFSDDRVVERARIGLAIEPFLDAYGLGEEARRNLAQLQNGAAERLRVEVSTSVPARAAQCWLQSPKERTAGHLSAFSKISRQLQRTLRLWLPYLEFSRSEQYGVPESAYAAIVYGASRPFHSKGRPEFSYDTMNLASVGRASRSANARLPRQFAEVRRFLLDSGQTCVADLYRQRLIPRIMRGVNRGNRHFLNLLVADRLAVERFTRLGNECRRLRQELANPDQPIRHVLRAATAVDRNFRSRFKRLLRNEDASTLGTLLLVEATASLDSHFGGRTPIQVTMRLSDADSPSREGGIVFRALRQPWAGEPV